MHQKFTSRRSRIIQLSCIALLLFGLVAFNGCSSSSDPPPPTAYADPVSTTGGLVSGEQQDDVHIYRGIPYAAPPVGERRWRPPQPADPWTGVLEATDWGPMAPQPEGDDDHLRGGIDEDCLYLNIVTPARYASDRFPVMVFFHGGGLSTHTGNSLLYNHTALPTDENVVVVTVNSRLGAIGYMAHPALTAESENDASGNYGTLDMIAALEWVRNNIAAFGGDAGNVTIFGESGGGTKVISLMTSRLADGLYHRAIVQSGAGSVSPPPLATPSLSVSEGRGVNIQNHFEIEGTDEEVLAALREKSWEEIIAAPFAASLTVDGYVLQDTVYNVFDNGLQYNVPFIVGAQTRDLGVELQVNVPRLANLMSRVQPDTYVYVFSHLPADWAAQDACAAFHGLELPYVFGYIPEGLDTGIVRMFADGARCYGEPGPDEIDHEVADYTTAMWAQFARTGNPSVAGLIDWPAYTEANDTYLDIAYPLAVKTGVADAYIPAPDPPPVDDETYTNIQYGFSLDYPGNWVEGAAAAPGVIWRVGGGGFYIPSVRVIVRPETDGADLEAVFTTHLEQDGGKNITSFSTSATTINGIDYDQAEVAYAGGGLDYDSMIIGRVVDEEWIIFEVYTVPSFAPFDSPTKQEDILNTVEFF